MHTGYTEISFNSYLLYTANVCLCLWLGVYMCKNIYIYVHENALHG